MRRWPEALVVGALAVTAATLATAAPPIVKPFSTDAAPTLMMTQLSAGGAARLRAVGLDPGDPNLAAKLRTRRETLQGTVLARPQALTLAHVRTVRETAGIYGQAPAAKPGTTVASARLRQDAARWTAMLGTLKISGLYQWKSTQLAPSPFPLETSPITPLIELPTKLGTDQFGVVGDSHLPTLTLSVPACGYSATIDPSFHGWFPPLLYASSSHYQRSWGLPDVALSGRNFYYVQNQVGLTAPRPLGAQPRAGTLAVAVPQFGQSSTAVTIRASTQQVTGALTVAGDPPSVGSNPFGVAGANSILAGTGPRANAGPPWGGQSGDDILGRGIVLGPGYTATASIVAAYSQADLPGQNPAANAYRSATVTGQPSSGRLETIVHWSYQAGESLAYSLQWELSGPAGQRAVMTMPLSGPCDS